VDEWLWAFWRGKQTENFPPISGCMPLNSHSYLVGQGWQGTGKALREGGISRPVVIAQKKSLAGVGKDRDEAYPFWDQ